MNNRLPGFSMKHDMKTIYRRLFEKYSDGFPEIVIFEFLDNDMEIAFHDLHDGRRIIYVKDADDDALLDKICKEVEMPSCKQSMIPCLGHCLKDKDVAVWCMYACYVAEMLNIDLQQIMFFHTDEPSGYSGVLPTVIGDDQSLPEMLICIAHELRHAWQHIHHPDWFGTYISPENEVDKYYAQMSEIDAEAFGIKVESIITGIDFIKSQAGLSLDPEYRDALIERINQIDVVLSKKKTKEIRKIIDLEGALKEITYQ